MHNHGKGEKMTTKLRTMVLRSHTDKQGKTTVTASAPTPDRYGDIVDASWNLDHFKTNSVVLWGHDYTQPPIGRVTDIGLEGKTLVASIEWDRESELGKTVASQFERGFLNAVSVGFTPGESIERSKLDKDDPNHGTQGRLFRQNELMELSAVCIPAHRGALAMRTIGGPSMLKHIMNVEETEDAWIISYAKGEMHDEPEDADDAEDADPAEDAPEEAYYEDDDDKKKEHEPDHEDDDEGGEPDGDDGTYNDEDEDEDDEDQERSMRAIARSVFLDLIGAEPELLERSTHGSQNDRIDQDPIAVLLGIDK